MHRLTVRIVDVYIEYITASVFEHVFVFPSVTFFFFFVFAPVLKQNTPTVRFTLLKFVRNLKASVLDSISSSEHLYINKLTHVHLFTDSGDILLPEIRN